MRILFLTLLFPILVHATDKENTNDNYKKINKLQQSLKSFKEWNKKRLSSHFEIHYFCKSRWKYRSKDSIYIFPNIKKFEDLKYSQLNARKIDLKNWEEHKLEYSYILQKSSYDSGNNFFELCLKNKNSEPGRYINASFFKGTPISAKQKSIYLAKTHKETDIIKYELNGKEYIFEVNYTLTDHNYFTKGQLSLNTSSGTKTLSLCKSYEEDNNFTSCYASKENPARDNRFVSISWAGDINNDNKLDFFISNFQDSKGGMDTLYISKKSSYQEFEFDTGH